MTAMPETLKKAIPAKLGFFAIYNPSLGTTDETLEDQIVYYCSSQAQERFRRHPDVTLDETVLRGERNEQLRQIGLSQGMVEFGRSFSDGQSVNTIETEKSRVILHELEAGWWVIASIDLMTLPITDKSNSAKAHAAEEYKIEYSSREVKPAILILGDILRAHSTFLLHHASSLSALFVRTRRPKFVGLLGRYWDMFLSTWQVSMHGNPANGLYGGIKIAACGELGMGVGEEERGSGEREVLEGFVGRIEGLVDVIVSKFGNVDIDNNLRVDGKRPALARPSSPWLGSGSDPAAEDGAIFLGTGALSRKSIRDVSHWIEDLYRWGPYAYGVIDNPSSNRLTKGSRKKQTVKRQHMSEVRLENVQDSCAKIPDGTSSFPESPTSGTSMSPRRIVDKVNSKPTEQNSIVQRDSSSQVGSELDSRKSNKFVQYLKMGYGTHWSLGSSTPTAGSENTPAPEVTAEMMSPSATALGTEYQYDSGGSYVIGLQGKIEDEEQTSTVGHADSDKSSRGQDDGGENDRMLLRTLTLELEREEDARAEADISIDLGHSNKESKSSKHTSSEHTATSNTSFEIQDRNKTKKLRVIVYVNRPFIFVFLFELRSEVLAMSSLYRSLHHQLGPLIKPLTSSTNFRVSRPDMCSSGDGASPIYDLVWDSKLLIVHSTIPNIPDPHRAQSAPSGLFPWTRTESINTHMQIINTYISSSADKLDLERTCKTSRGWWVVWTKIPSTESTMKTTKYRDPPKAAGHITEDSTGSHLTPGSGLGTPRGTSSMFGASIASSHSHPYLDINDGDPALSHKEVFLIRRASDYGGGKLPNRLVSGASQGSSEGWISEPGKLAQGIGVDTKRYIEALLKTS